MSTATTQTMVIDQTPSASTSAHPSGRPSQMPAPAVKGSFLSKYTEQYVVPPHLAPAALQICITAFPLGLVAGLVLPRAFRFLITEAPKLLTAAPAETTMPWYLLPQLHLYLLAWCLFHLFEFTITASYNPTRLFSDSFLLNNGISYHIAHVFGLMEFIVTAIVKPQWKQPGVVTLFGLLVVVVGQSVRSLAMVHASSNFSHIVAVKKREDHQLVKTGVYSFTRHPSYFGFFYWALGTQILLANPVGVAAFALVLWRFFSHRIRVEEKHLIEFFKEEYVEYKRQVGTHLPFIS